MSEPIGTVFSCGPIEVDGRPCCFYSDFECALLLHRPWPLAGDDAAWAPMVRTGASRSSSSLACLLSQPAMERVETTIDRLLEGLGSGDCASCGATGAVPCAHCATTHPCHCCASSGLSKIPVLVLGVPVRPGLVRTWLNRAAAVSRAGTCQVAWCFAPMSTTDRVLLVRGDGWTFVAVGMTWLNKGLDSLREVAL